METVQDVTCLDACERLCRPPKDGIFVGYELYVIMTPDLMAVMMKQRS